MRKELFFYMTFYFQNLIVWQKAFLLSQKVHICIKNFPNEEKYALIDQMRRSSLSIVSNIAEWSGRWTNPEYKHFLHIAKWSSMELATQILLSDKFGYFPNDDVKEELLSLIEEVVKMLYTMIQNK